MASTPVKERLAQDVGQWVTDGLISPDTARVLRVRWDQPGFGLAQVVKYLSISGGLLVLFGLFGAAVAMTSSEGFAGVALCAAGGGGLYAGVRLASDPSGRYAASSNVVLALGMLAFALGVGVFTSAAGLSEYQAVFGTGIVALPLAFVLAYRFRNTFLLSLGLIGAFHWVGSWTSMFGRSTYAVSIEDPLTMCVAALLSIGVGIAEERKALAATPRFHHAYQSLGLIYLNLSLLILTIDGSRATALPFIVLWAAAGIAQVVVGARMHSALFTAFGVTALAINLYTRYYELFWDALDAGLFLLLGGALMFGVGFAFELRARRGSA